MPNNQPLLTPREVAERLGISVQTLASWRCNSTYPLEFCRIGRLIRYRQEAVEKFIRENTYGNEADGDTTE